MARKWSVLGVAFVVGLSSCTAEIEDPRLAGEDAVLDHVEALGYEREAAIVSGDHVVVEGDLRFNRVALLRGDYERLAEVDEHGALIDKGYRYPGVIAAKHRGNIRLVFGTGAFAPSRAIRDAFIAAANAWSAVPGSSIRISTANTGPAIVVRTVPVARWKKYAAGCDDTDACADVPLNGRPGYEIFIRAESIYAGCETWEGSNLANVTRHELGHALGFAHPKEKGSKLAAGTRSCAGSAATCEYEPGYSTIMSAPSVTAGCTFTPSRVTQDDYATARTVYPAQ